MLAYVLLTGRQPFSSPKTDDPMVVMRRIVDDNWHIKYPPYLSAAAKVDLPLTVSPGTEHVDMHKREACTAPSPRPMLRRRMPSAACLPTRPARHTNPDPQTMNHPER